MAQSSGGRDHWVRWQQSWDRQQQSYLPDREERFQVMIDLLGAITESSSPRVLDLACGCGSISSRALVAYPAGSSLLLDFDPVLLRIASGVFQGDHRVSTLETDLRGPEWGSILEPGSFDAVLTATALHWLPPESLAQVYRGCAGLLRPGGLLANADHMPLLGAPGLELASAALSHAAHGGGDDPWRDWWAGVEEEPELAALLPERNRRFGGELHPAEFTPGASWHQETLQQAGFAESAVLWRRGGDALVAAIR